MGPNFTDWLGNNPWALWLTLAVLLGVAEMLTLDLILIMVGVGCLAAAGVALVAPTLWPLQIIVAVAVSVLTLLVLRPTLLAKVRNAPGYRSALDKMVGSTGLATAAITRHGGEVKIDGQTWSARTFDSDTVIEAGRPVEVYEVDGVTAVVYPVDGSPSDNRTLEN